MSEERSLEVAAPPPLYYELEQRSFSSWPALVQTVYRGWIVRLGDGYTKRANSVTALAFSGENLGESISHCETLYRERGLTPIFRLTPYTAPGELDAQLVHRRYRILDPSQVLHLDLTGWRQVGPADTIEAASVDTWLASFGHLSNSAPDGLDKHASLLRRITSHRLLTVLRDRESQPIGCGLGVLEEDCLGLFDLVIHPEMRQQGHGRTMVSAMLCWAQERGARHAYLQVMESNLPAQRLYRSLGFEKVYPYWYRIAPENSSPPIE